MLVPEVMPAILQLGVEEAVALVREVDEAVVEVTLGEEEAAGRTGQGRKWTRGFSRFRFLETIKNEFGFHGLLLKIGNLGHDKLCCTFSIVNG